MANMEIFEGLRETYGSDLPSDRARLPITEILALQIELTSREDIRRGRQSAQAIVDLEGQSKRLGKFAQTEYLSDIDTEEEYDQAIKLYVESYASMPDAELFGQLVAWRDHARAARKLREESRIYVALAEGADKAKKPIEEFDTNELTRLALAIDPSFANFDTPQAAMDRWNLLPVEFDIAKYRKEEQQYTRGHRAEAMKFMHYTNGIIIEAIAEILIETYADRFGKDLWGSRILLADSIKSYAEAVRLARPIPGSLAEIARRGIYYFHPEGLSLEQVLSDSDERSEWARILLPEERNNAIYQQLIRQEADLESYRRWGEAMSELDKMLQASVQASRRLLRIQLLASVLQRCQNATESLNPEIEMKIHSVMDVLLGNIGLTEREDLSAYEGVSDEDLTPRQLLNRYEQAPLAQYAQVVEYVAKRLGILPLE